MKKIIGVCLAACGLLNAAGFKIPEQSNDSVALLNSNVATSFGADAAYNNPANMVFLDGERSSFENSLTYLQMAKTKFSHADGQKFTSKKAGAFVPTFHFVSPKIGDSFRVGFSLVAKS